MAKVAKKMAVARALVDRARAYTLEEGIEILRQAAAARKLPESIEIAMNLGVDPRHADQAVRGSVVLPAGTGKDVRVAVFARDAKADEAREAGAEIVGAEDLIEAIKGGKTDFDRCIATPDMMGLVGQVARVLGPKGLMPNPKVGTVTPNVGEAVKAAKGGAVQFRAEKAGIVHGPVGKAAFAPTDIAANVRAFVDAIIRAKPAGAKGTYVRRVSLSSTMGPGLRVDLASITQAA